MTVCRRLPPAGDFTADTVVSDGDFSPDSAHPMVKAGSTMIIQETQSLLTVLATLSSTVISGSAAGKKKPAYSQLPIRTIIMLAASKIQP